MFVSAQTQDWGNRYNRTVNQRGIPCPSGRDAFKGHAGTFDHLVKAPLMMLISDTSTSLPRRLRRPENDATVIDVPASDNLQYRPVDPALGGQDPPVAPSHIPDDTSGIGDWEHLLTAVTQRLRSIVDGKGSAATATDIGRVRADVLECVGALDQLHQSLPGERARRQQLEAQARDALAALEQSRADLATTRAGERRAQHLARHDALTSLPNSRYFRERLGELVAHQHSHRRAFAVLFLDLDTFKPVNDDHGHVTGDEVLRVIAARLTRVVRAEDMVSRLGGDEFGCLVLDVLDREQLNRLAGKLFDAVSASIKIGNLQFTVRPSIGIALFPFDGATVEALLHSADAAMYRAKRHHIGFAFYNQYADT